MECYTVLLLYHFVVAVIIHPRLFIFYYYVCIRQLLMKHDEKKIAMTDTSKKCIYSLTAVSEFRTRLFRHLTLLNRGITNLICLNARYNSFLKVFFFIFSSRLGYNNINNL